MTLEAQDIVNQVSATNQKSVELLALIAKSNTLLMEYILVKETETETPAGRRRVELTAAPKLLSAPEEGLVTRRKSGPRLGSDGLYHAPPKSKNAMLIRWAQEHGNQFDVRAFQDHAREIGLKPVSFMKTTVYSIARQFVTRGVFAKLSPVLYELTAPYCTAAQSTAQTLIPEPAKTVTVSVPSSRRDLLTEFAQSHNGVFAVQTAKREWKKRRDIPPTFLKTTAFTELSRLVKAGTMRKVSPGVYELVKAAKAAAI